MNWKPTKTSVTLLKVVCMTSNTSWQPYRVNLECLTKTRDEVINAYMLHWLIKHALKFACDITRFICVDEIRTQVSHYQESSVFIYISMLYFIATNYFVKNLTRDHKMHRNEHAFNTSISSDRSELKLSIENERKNEIL